MKRIFLFLVTNLAAVATLSLVTAVVCSFCGVDVSQLGAEGGYAPLLLMAFLMGMAGSVVSLLMSKTMARASVKARPIDGSEGDTERWLVATVADLAGKAGLKTPEVAVYHGEPNAFATGAFKNSALVAVSDGILAKMSKEELRAVLGHEMSHVANGDMVTMALTQGVINTFVIFFAHVIAGVVQGALSGGKNARRSRGGYGLYHVIVQVCQLVFGLFASVVLMWYSRRREFAADAGSAALLGSPGPMISALRRLGGLEPGALPDSMKAFGIAGRPSALASLFASHPPLEARIAALSGMPPPYAA